MKYRDLTKMSFWTSEEWETQCLVWSAHYEHAVFSIHDAIHPQAKYVWLKPKRLLLIHAYYKHWKTGKWILAELKKGNIPLVNNNPFQPCGNAASNTAVSVFPQNMKTVRGLYV